MARLALRSFQLAVSCTEVFDRDVHCYRSGPPGDLATPKSHKEVLMVTQRRAGALWLIAGVSSGAIAFFLVESGPIRTVRAAFTRQRAP